MFPFDTASPQSAVMAELFNLIAWIAAVIFVLVTLGVIWSAWRYRHKGDNAEPRQIEGNLPLEIGWTLIPLLILAFVAVRTVAAMDLVDPAPPANATPDLIITGHQWWWEIEYPQAGVMTANEIHAPAGQRLLLQLAAADVLHSFWLPQLARKVDMIPGQTRWLWLEVAEPGVYSGACAEFCGAQHAWMRLRLTAHPQLNINSGWTSRPNRPPFPRPAPGGGGAIVSRAHLRQLSRHCGYRCTGARGAGPNACGVAGHVGGGAAG
ncbi:MAG: cytochrome c oxidase subunit II [Caldilineaceae bacterium]